MTPGHAQPVSTELWHRAVPVLPTHDVTLTAGFWGALGFGMTISDDGSYLILETGDTELHYRHDADLDPFRSASSAYLRVTNADLLHAELYEADVMPDLTARDAGDAEELRARWDGERDLARLGVLYDAAHGMREFVLFDPSNNLLTCGHPL
jgi:hypothetical protein